MPWVPSAKYDTNSKQSTTCKTNQHNEAQARIARVHNKGYLDICVCMHSLQCAHDCPTRYANKTSTQARRMKEKSARTLQQAQQLSSDSRQTISGACGVWRVPFGSAIPHINNTISGAPGNIPDDIHRARGQQGKERYV